MPTVAEQLRTARESQALSIEEVADLTKLRTDHVRALESGDYGFFSAPVYVRGFTRTYAKLLKLDVATILEAQAEEMRGESSPERDADPLGPSRGLIDVLSLYLSRINWKLFLPILILFALVAIGSLGVKLWNYQQTHDPLADLSEGRYESQTPLPSAYLPLPPPPVPATN